MKRNKMKWERIEDEDWKWDENWCECILMWWSTDETKINLSHIWVRSEQDVWRMRWDETHFNVIMHRNWNISESHLSQI